MHTYMDMDAFIFHAKFLLAFSAVTHHQHLVIEDRRLFCVSLHLAPDSVPTFLYLFQSVCLFVIFQEHSKETDSDCMYNFSDILAGAFTHERSTA